MHIANSSYEERLTSAVTLTTLAATSVLCCSLVILATFMGRLYKKPVNLLVANVASADLLLNIVNLVLQPPNIMSDDKSFYCNWAGWITYICGLQANWGVPVLVLNRYVAIFKGDMYKRIFPVKNIILIIISSWIIVILVTLPYHVAGRTGYENSYENCGVNDGNELKWKLLILLFLVIPTFAGNGITAYCNIKIFARFREHAKSKTIQSNVVSRNKELMYVTLIHVAFACLLQGPYIFGKMVPEAVEGNVLRQIFPCLYCLNSTLSALSTLCVIKPYRETTKKLLRCKKMDANVMPVANDHGTSNLKQMVEVRRVSVMTDAGRRNSAISYCREAKLTTVEVM